MRVIRNNHKYMGREGELSHEEFVVKKEDLSPRERLMMLKKLQEAKGMENLADAFDDIASIQETIAKLTEEVKFAIKENNKELFGRLDRFMRKFESFITHAEQGERLNRDDILMWQREVDQENFLQTRRKLGL